MDMPNHDNLIDFYAAHKLEQARANYKLLAGAIASDSIKPFDVEDFWENQSSLIRKTWMYVAAPPLWHPLQKTGRNGGSEKDLFIRFLPIPPLYDKFRNSEVSGQAVPSIDNLLFRQLILDLADYQSMDNARVGHLASQMKEKIQSVFTLIVTFYQHKDILSWWELTELAGADTAYSAYEEWLPPLVGSDFKVSGPYPENSGFGSVKDTIMPDNDNVLFLFDEHIIHLILSTSEKSSMTASGFNFCCIRGEHCTFYYEDGFLHYFWKEKQWSSGIAIDSEYILLSPDDDDHIFHVQKKMALDIPEFMDQAMIKVKNVTGDFGLIMDKEAHGGVYDLRTLSKVVDTGQLSWYDDAEEITLKGLESTNNVSQKAATFWVGDKQYKLLAYGRVIVNNKLIRSIPAAISSACFSPDGSYLVLVSDKRCFVLETAGYTSIMDFE